jgi:hypothetical protein
MESISGKVKISYSDSEINTILKENHTGNCTHTAYFSQNEDFFLKLSTPFTVPHFPIHHDIHKTAPKKEYIQALRLLMSQLVQSVPWVFEDLIYFFDPSEILRPCFFQLYKLQDRHFLYLLRLDLMFRTLIDTVVDNGTNDVTPEFQTERLYAESSFIPLDGVEIVDGKISSFEIWQTISETWIGETGRGYFLQGIWMDQDLTKFFTKLFLPKGKRLYPYYPLACKFRTVCMNLLDISLQGRRESLPILKKAMDFLIPGLRRIEDALRAEEFSEKIPVFSELYAELPEAYRKFWMDLTIRPYLNSQDMREFIVEF